MVEEKPSRDAELEYRLSLRKIDAVVSLGKYIIKWGCLVVIFYFIYGMTNTLAGKRTLATIGISILGSIKLGKMVCATVTGGSLIYGFGQKILRQNTIRRLSARKNEIERIMDPNRTSSDLTKWGTTKREDKA